MKKTAILLAIVLLCFSRSFAQSSGSGKTTARLAIEKLNREMQKAFNANDMMATAAFYSDDAEIIGEKYVVSGRQNLDKDWLNLKDLGKGWKLSVVEIGGAGDYLYQLGNSDLTYLVNGKETKSVTNFVLIWKKQNDGSYKIFRDYLTDVEFKNVK